MAKTKAFATCDATAPQLLTARDVAARLKCSTDSVYRLMRRGELAYVRVLSDKRVTEQQLASYIARQMVA